MSACCLLRILDRNEIIMQEMIPKLKTRKRTKATKPVLLLQNKGNSKQYFYKKKINIEREEFQNE